MRQAIIIAIVVLVAGAVWLLWFSGWRGRDQTLRRLNENGTVVRRSCGLGEAHVDAGRWQRLDPSDQERAASAIASWCAEQGGLNTLTVLDSDSRAILARWNGTSLERQP